MRQKKKVKKHKKRKDTIYIFADGPNFYMHSRSDNSQQIYIEDIKKLVEERYGDIAKFIWYDFKPDIIPNSVEQMLKANPLDSGLESLIGNPQELQRIIEMLRLEEHNQDLKNLLKRYVFYHRIFRFCSKKNKFFYAIKDMVDLDLEDYSSINQTCIFCRERLFIVTEKGKTDMRLSNDMIYHAGKNDYDLGVLIGGDGDYSITIKHSQDFGKKIVVVFFEAATSKELIKVANGFLPLDKIRP